VVHGIPNATKLRDGDIISVDIGVIREGFFGDSARTFAVGKIDSSAKQLLQVTQEALQLSIEKANKNNHLQDISAAVQRHVEKFGFSIVRDFVGHGIGRDLHEDPPIPNFGMPGYGPKLEVGMVLAIEPMVNEGKPEVKIDKDGWTARTKDGKRSAHFEHSVAITESGPVILSKVA
jgi:methionyl aminopeptidase